MHKWKPTSHLKRKLLNKPVIKDETGITLVELLAVLSILSVVILLGGAIHMFGQRQFVAQSESASQANDLSYAMTILSNDLRTHRYDELVTIEADLIEFNNGDKFEVKNRSLYKNESKIADNISSMTPENNDSDKSLNVTLRSESLKGQSDKNITTTIYFRE